jgi:hypothetical protein
VGAGGSFTSSGNVVSPYFAQWGCAPICYPDCDASGSLTPQDFACFQLTFTFGDPYADCNADSILTVADFGCFQTRYVLQDPYADCNEDGQLTVADFGCFQTKFVTGCP